VSAREQHSKQGAHRGILRADALRESFRQRISDSRNLWRTTILVNAAGGMIRKSQSTGDLPLKKSLYPIAGEF